MSELCLSFVWNAGCLDELQERLLCTHVSDRAPLLQRLEHASKLGVQLRICCLCSTLNYCIICSLVQLLLPACPGLLLLQTCCCVVFVGFADLMGRNVLILALESGWADAALIWNQFFLPTPPSLSQSLRWGCPSGAGCSSH